MTGTLLRAFAVAITLPVTAAAQPANVPRIGVLPSLQLPAGAPLVEAFEQGLRDLGYVAGKNVILEYRWTKETPERVHDHAAELVRLKVDAIVVGSGATARAATKATKSIPIVMAVVPDPVAEGLVTSLARPGGNVTGLSFLSGELAGKQLGLLKETIPALRRVAVFWTPTIPSHAGLLKQLHVAANTLGVVLQAVDVRGPNQLEDAFAAMRRERADGFLVLPNSQLVFHQKRLHDLAARHGLPAMYAVVEHASGGGLMAYGADLRANWRRAASYVDKIVKGAKPSDLPVEQPTRFEFVVNLRTARALGLTIPASVLLRADAVIE